MKRVIFCLLIICFLAGCKGSQAKGKWVYAYSDGDADIIEFSSNGSFSCVFWDGEQKKGKYEFKEGDEGIIVELKTDEGTQYLSAVFDRDSLTLAGRVFVRAE